MTDRDVQGGMATVPSPPFQLVTLKKRADFKAAANGPRFSTPSFTMLRRPETEAAPASSILRFGFTVTKKVGNAVERNRIRRRLREAVRAAAPHMPAQPMDLVILARRSAIERPFAEMVADIIRAVEALSQRDAAKRPRSTAGAGPVN